MNGEVDRTATYIALKGAIVLLGLAAHGLGQVVLPILKEKGKWSDAFTD